MVPARFTPVDRRQLSRSVDRPRRGIICVQTRCCFHLIAPDAPTEMLFLNVERAPPPFAVERVGNLAVQGKGDTLATPVLSMSQIKCGQRPAVQHDGGGGGGKWTLT